MKVFIIIEKFEKDYPYTDGFVNSVFADKQKAESIAEFLRKSENGKEYSNQVIEREIIL